MLIPITDPTCVSQARGHAKKIAGAAGFTVEGRERAAIVASELASNIVRHAGRGQISIQAFRDGEGAGVELMALDAGPGMSDLARCMTDGFSTAGGAGTGLGAVRRLADVFDVYTRPQQGTAVLARLTLEAGAPHRRIVACGLASPLPGEDVCGDDFAWCSNAASASIVLADGLGHGAGAAAAARRAVECFEAKPEVPPDHLIGGLHAELRATRGAAVAAVRMDMKAGVVDYCAVGNIAGVLIERGEARRMISSDGIVGHVAGRIRSFQYPFANAPILVVHSDGLSSRWDLATYPGLWESHPALIAGVLFRDFRRNRDDASIFVLKWRSP